jgi:PKD repeat protein
MMSHVNKIVAGLSGKSVFGSYRRIFKARLVTVLALVLSLCVFTSLGVQAKRATPQEMERVCQNWLTYMVSEKGAWAGETNPQITDIQEMIANDTVLARCFSIAPSGYVVVPVLKELPPIKANSEECNLDVNKEHGFPQLLREVLLDRIRVFARTYGSLDATQPSKEDVLFGKVHGQQWDRFSVDPDEFETDLNKGMSAPVDTTVGPLLTISWNQQPPYNNFCPWGDGGRCVVGCVATAAAQIMAYYRWPEAGYGSSTYYWNGDQSCGGSTSGMQLSADYSDEYDWANIPDNCHSGCSPEEEAALAELNYEVAVAFKMDFGYCASGVLTSQIPSCMNAFETNFRYHDQMVQSWRQAYTSENWFNLIKSEVNEDRPIWYFITSHSLVCDGWREVGDPVVEQYHMNYGWDDWHTTWWTLDQYYCPVDDGNPDSCFQQHEFLVSNIAPDKGIWLSADATFGWAPFDVHFTGLSEYSVDEWIWDFGDDNGATVFEDTVTHTYDSSGIFDVSLAIDTGGDTLTLQRSDYIIVLADSMIAVDTVGGKGDTVEMVIRARNTIPLNKIIIPFETFGTLNVAHKSGAFSTDGCRTEDFETQSYLHFDPSHKRYTIELETSSADLEPGEGSIIKLYFIIPGVASSGQTDTVELDGYFDYLPLFSGNIAEYQAVPVAGTISISGCCNDDGIRGDADYSGGAPNVGDISHLVDYLFGAPPGPEPPCFEEGDVDASGSINVGDISYLVEYMFGTPAGPAPLPCP